MIDVKKFIGSAVKATRDNLPGVCTAVGVVGTWATAISCGHDTMKAMEHLEAYKAQLRKEGKSDDLGWWDILKVCAKDYVMTFTFGAITTASDIASMKINSSRNAALASLAAVGQDMMVTYSEKVIEAVGEKKEREIRDAAVAERAERVIHTQPRIMTDTPIEIIEGREYFIVDVPTQQVGKGTSNKISAAENIVNRRIMSNLENEVTLADFFEELDPERIRPDHPLCKFPNGFNLSHPLEVTITVKAWNGIPAYYIDYPIWNLMTNTPAYSPE